MLRVVSLCSGIGGFDLAAEWAGMEVVGQVEIDPYCRRVLAKHWPHVKRVPDLFDVKGDEFGSVDIVCAGFPCQPYSVAGKRGGAADDRAIWPEVLRVTLALKPIVCVYENVPGFVRMALDDVCLDLEAAGYEVQPLVFPACGVGAWHKRERVFIVAHDVSHAPECANERRIAQPTEWPVARCDGAGNTDVPDADRTRSQGYGRLGGERDGAGEWPAGRHVQMFPTPTGDDANNVTRQSGAYQSLTRAVNTRGSAGTDDSPSTPSGSLNPRWVAWLMGFPDEWLNLEP